MRMARRGCRVFAGVLSFIAIPSLLAAQVHVPPSAVLRLPSSPVALSLGDVGIVSTNADVLFYNPGMLSQARGVAASVQQYGSGGTAGAFASVQALGSVSVAVGARLADWSHSTGTRVFAGAMGGGDVLLPRSGPRGTSSLALSAGAARPVGPLRVGLGATYLRESASSDHQQAMLFDVGAALSMGFTTLGVVVQHVGETPALPGGFLPTHILPARPESPWRGVIGFGAGGPLSTWFDFGVTAQVAVTSSWEVQPAGGLELSYVPLEGVAIAGRVGARQPRDAGESAATAGVGFTLDRYSLDYAIEPFRDGPAAHRVGVRIR